MSTWDEKFPQRKNFQSHYIKPNHGCEFPQRLIIVDTEAWTEKNRWKDGFKQKLRMGYAIYCRFVRGAWSQGEPFFFTTIQEFHAWLDEHLLSETGTRVWLIAHHMSYDWATLGLDGYFGRTAVWRAPTIDSLQNPCLFKVQSVEGKHGVLVMSTTNWYKESLEALAKSFGLVKLKHPKEGEWDSWPDEEMRPYCLNDCTILTAIVLKHIQNVVDNDLGTVKATAAGQAMASVFHRFTDFQDKTKVPYVHQEPRTTKLEMDSYRGGRTECFRLGSWEGIYGLDVNSMYPAQYDKFLPVKPLFSHPIRLGERQDLPLDDAFVIARCLVDLKQPALSYRREDGALINPVGHLNMSLTSAEITMVQHDSSIGSIKEVEEYMAYKQFPILKAFKDYFYPLKVNGDLVQSKHAKTSLNACYGKWAEHQREEFIDCTDMPGSDDLALMMVREGTLRKEFSDGFLYTLKGNRLMRQHAGKLNRGELTENAIPSIASAVTSYARCMLWSQGISIAGDQALYTDTDSLFVFPEGLEVMREKGFCDQTALGKWKVDKGPFHLDLYGPKFYRIDGKLKCKGVPQNAEEIETDVFEYEQLSTGLSRLRSGVADGVPVKKLIKHMSREYKKGIVQPDGTIKPFERKDW